MASKTMLVAQREYLENVRTKTFWIGIFIVPILIGASIGIGALLRKFKEVQKYAVVDTGSADFGKRAERAFRQKDVSAMFEMAAKMQADLASGDVDPKLQTVLEGMTPGEEPSGDQMYAMYEWMQSQPPEDLAKYEGIGRGAQYEFVSLNELELADRSPEEQEEELNKLVGKDELFAFFVLGDDPLKDTDNFRYVSNNLTDDGLLTSYGSTLTNLVRKDRIADAGIDAAVAKHIQARVSFKKKKVSKAGEAEDVKNEDTASSWAPMAFVYLLWMAVFSIANLLLTNTIEEKSNRIIEVLLSSVSPSQLMHGKIYGIALTGLTIVGTWVFFALLTAWLAPMFLGDSGKMIDFLVAALGNTGYLASFVLYFLGGFLLYAAVLVAIGSVCNTLKEAQNLMQPVVMILMVPLISMMFITKEPNGTVAKVMSFIPLFTPFTMMNRAAGPPETWEYIVTSILLVATIWFAFKAAAKVFRVGVLMTGNPPKLKEILGWLWKS
ncbi:MAG: ABC transporter permease [Planctomycetota bacterium]